MRIGQYVPQVISEYHPSRSRTVVSKIVPLYAQPLYFDIVSNAWNIQLSGALIGTSKTDLSNQMISFAAQVKQKGVLWVDVSDQYPYSSLLCRVTDIDGPTLNSDKDGILIAEWTLKAVVLLPWGTTLVSNPWNTQSSTILRDLNAIGKSPIINPLESACNFQLNQNSSFSWEFIVDNQNLYNAASQITSCDTTTGFTTFNGGSPTINNNVFLKRQGTACVHLNATSDTFGNLQITYDNGSGINLSSYEFFCLWARADWGGLTTNGGMSVYLETSGGNLWRWDYPGANKPYQWYRLVVPLVAPNNTTGSPTLSSVRYYQVASIGGTPGVNSNVWADDFVVDTGRWIYLETMLPDNLSQNQFTNTLQVASWNGSSYVTSYSIDSFGSDAMVPAALWLLNGHTNSTYFSNEAVNSYAPGAIGTSAIVSISPTEGEPGSITYSTVYGTSNRFMFALKMPPATSDSLTGNMPSNDITGAQAINKARLKFFVFNSDEQTTYSGM